MLYGFLYCDCCVFAGGVKFEVRRVWVECLAMNKAEWKDRAAKGSVNVSLIRYFSTMLINVLKLYIDRYM